MTNNNLSKYIEQYMDLKNKLQIEAQSLKFESQKFSDYDARFLASRLLELPSGIPSSLYFEVKNNHELVPYRFIGTRLLIREIKISTSNEVKSLKLSFQILRGINQIPFILTKALSI